MDIFSLSTKKISYLDFEPFFNGSIKIDLTDEAISNIKKSHAHFKKKLDSNEIIYGVNTGFGNLSNILIDHKDQKKLQLNLVRSHSSGIGNPLELGLVRTILYLKLHTYAKGYSGVRIELARKIVEFLNHDIMPVIPEKGSVGASGDLAPMGHMALALIGEGEVFYQSKKRLSIDVLNELSIDPIVLDPKEGLSLINGTQVSTAIAIKTLIQGYSLLRSSDIVGSISVENSFSSRNVFKKEVHLAKVHPGQQVCADNIYRILEDSDIVESHKNCGKVQDPYSFRCIPHVHGASRDIFTNASKIINNEINSVSDNPLILKDGSIISSGHFHAEHVAQALDTLGIAFSELGAISERRSHYFMKGVDGRFPPFVTKNPGIESGYMIAHVTASALASENKTLAHPASVDSISSSGGQEDLVSMAPWAGYKLLKIQENVYFILAVELLIAGAANYISSVNKKSGKGLRTVIKLLALECDFESGDRPLASEINKLKNFIESGKLLNEVDKYITME
ncbi:MAG: histidine ammonia-lyase [Fidelibacterota bacterium]|jgi:histidine ammonia-lyase